MKKRFLPFGLLLAIMVLGQSVLTAQGNSVYWHSMGPTNMGGRTTSVLFDNQTSKDVYIGTMGGGVFYSWNEGITWHQVGDDLMVSCLAQDEDGTIYVGTGDGGNAVDYNGLADLGYDHGFIGTGLYTIKNKQMAAVPSTTPVNENDTDEWSFINDIAIVGDYLVVATDAGVRYLAISDIDDAAATWRYAKVDGEDLTGVAMQVKVISDDTFMASVDGALYIGTLDAMVCRSAATATYDEAGMIDTLAIADGLLDIAVAPSDSDVLYAAAIGTTGNHTGVYLSEDQGATWRMIVPAVNNNNGHQLYETRGLFNHGICVDPLYPYTAYILGYNLWRMDRPTEVEDEVTVFLDGYYLVVKQSDGDNDNIFNPTYLHTGINAMAFDPRDDQKAFVATDGGIFQAQMNSTLYPTFASCNRGNVTARAFNVAPTKDLTRLVAGLMDHGPILIEGADYNHNGYSIPIWPSSNPADYGTFSATSHGGYCAVSTVNPDIIFASVCDGSLRRSETSFADYDVSNFSGQTFSFSGYRMPIALWESYNFQNSIDSVWFKCKKNQHAGDVVKCYSENGNYPFDFTLPYDMTFNELFPLQSDSILVKDPIASKFFVADGSAVYLTMDGLKFSKTAVWYKLATTGGVASCITVSADGDVVLVGTRNGKVIRISNLLNVYDENTADPTSEAFAAEVTVMELDVTDQYVSSVALSNDNKKMVVTLGNYGKDTYVLYSNNADAAEPTFVSKQANLPLMPVYSSLIEMTTGDVFLGTEHGIYMTQNIAGTPNWVIADTHMGDVPVMDLKQQTLYVEDQLVPTIVNDAEVMVPYAGINNQGVIYAATYGKGIFRCENYRLHSGDGIVEAPVMVDNSVEFFPNPVRNAATVRFDLQQNTNVSYQVFDMTGRLVRDENLGGLNEGNHEFNVSVEGLATGAYMLRLNAGKNSANVKFMVQ